MASGEGVSISPTGRSVFWDYEEIPVAIAATGPDAAVKLTGPDGTMYFLKIPVAGDRAYFTIAPHTLQPGQWGIESAEFGAVTVVSSIVRTHFTHGVFAAGSVVDSYEAVRDVYGWNHYMVFPPRQFPVTPAQVDKVTLAEATFSSINAVSSGHQPDNKKREDWIHPEIVESVPYRVKHAALYLRPYGGFRGVHYADEPGLDWQKTKDGMYFGPMGVKDQLTQYTKETGKPAPNPLAPKEDMDAWMEWMLWRSGLLGREFGRYTKAIKEIDTNLVGYSQIYEWGCASDGCYPANVAPNVDLMSTHAYPDRSLGMWYPAHEVDALRSGYWNKPMWMMPTFMNLQPADALSSCVYAALSRKLEGLLWGLNWGFIWPETKTIMARIVPISDMLLYSQKIHDEVAILYSHEELLNGFAQDVRNYKSGRDYVGRLLSAWLVANGAHYPVTRMNQEDLYSGEFKPKVLIAPNLTYTNRTLIKALEKYVEDGGILFVDGTATLEIKGAKRLPFPYESCYFLSGREMTDKQRWDKYAAPYIADFAKALDPYVKPPVVCDNPMFMTSIQGSDAGRYAWVVNMAEESRGRWCPVAATGTVTLGGSEPAIYDVFAGKKMEGRTFRLEMPRGDCKIYAMMPDEIAGVEIVEARWESPNLKIKTRVMGKTGKPVDAIIPLTVELVPGKTEGRDLFAAPDKMIFRRFYRATSHGIYEEILPIGCTATPGEWKLAVKEQLGGAGAEAKFTVPKPTDLVGFDTAMADVVDPDRIAASLSRDRGEILLLCEGPDGEAAAKKVAGFLAGRGVKATIDTASGYATNTAPVSLRTCYLKNAVPLLIHKQVVLFGNAKTNPLVDRMVNSYRLSPRQFANGYPGPGRALLFWEQGMFGLNNDIVVVYADDANGLDVGVKTLAALVAGEPRPTVTALPAGAQPARDVNIKTLLDDF